jgi:phosphate transport system protein
LQPAASDLRLITTGPKITTDLERIGDNAVNICERVLEFNQHPLPIAYIDIPRMAAVGQSMVQDSLDAFARGDATLAEQVIARDDEVDSLNDQVYDQLLTLMTEDPQTIARATPILFVTKYLERIADHAANIAEMAVFLIKERDIRHMDKRQQIGQKVR